MLVKRGWKIKGHNRRPRRAGERLSNVPRLGGVGTLRLVDQDTVELNNLHRQVLYTLADLRYPKVEAAARHIAEINPETRVEAIPENLDSENVAQVLR